VKFVDWWLAISIGLLIGYLGGFFSGIKLCWNYLKFRWPEIEQLILKRK
jgi:uncharacterized protein YneF (UPF0154 family)